MCVHEHVCKVSTVHPWHHDVSSMPCGEYPMVCLAWLGSFLVNDLLIFRMASLHLSTTQLMIKIVLWYRHSEDKLRCFSKNLTWRQHEFKLLLCMLLRLWGCNVYGIRTVSGPSSLALEWYNGIVTFVFQDSCSWGFWRHVSNRMCFTWSCWSRPHVILLV